MENDDQTKREDWKTQWGFFFEGISTIFLFFFAPVFVLIGVVLELWPQWFLVGVIWFVLTHPR